MNKEFYEKVINLPIDELAVLITETSNVITDSSNKLIILLEMQQDRISEMKINSAVVECLNQSCNTQFVKRPRQKFCSNACKQAHYRSKRSNTNGNTQFERNPIK